MQIHAKALRLMGACNQAIHEVITWIVAILVVVEVLVLTSGVIARYVLHTPLVWSDEVASILFLWLAMLGSAVAIWRGEHMRMTALVGMVSPSAKGWFDVFAAAGALVFLVLNLVPTFEYAIEEIHIVTSALEISNAWRASAMPIGTVLMAIAALARLAAAPLNRSLIALATITLVCASLYLVSPVFASLGNFNLIIFFVIGVIALVFISVPIAFAFGLATYGYLALTTHMPLTVIVGRMDEGMSHLILLAIPLFVFLGQLLEVTGLARVMLNFLANLLGHVRGGLAYVLIGAMYLVSGISGSKSADMAAVAPVLFPEMIKRGAKPGDLVALLAVTGAQTETVPPSLVLITLGAVTGVSIAALFTAGLLPSAILGVVLCFVVGFRYRHEDVSNIPAVPGKAIVRSFLIAIPALALPFIIRAAVIEGVATATEVSTIGIAYALLVGALVYREMDWSRCKTILVETASLSGAILLIIGTATAMAWALTQSGFSSDLASVMMNLPGGAATFMVASIIVFIVLGSVLEGIPAIVLFAPLLFPIAQQVGIHEIHYSIVVILAMGVGLFCPPFGVGYYVACAVGRVNPDEGIRPLVGYMMALLIGLAFVAAIPWLSIGFL